MKTFRRGAPFAAAMVAAVAATLLFGSWMRAYADYPARDGSGTIQNFASVIFNGSHHPKHLMEGLTGGAGNPQPLNVDVNGNLGLQQLPKSTPASIGDNGAFQGAVAMAPGTTYPAQRSIGIIATQSGNVALTLADGSTIVLPVIGTSTGLFQSFPFAVTAVNTSGTTATATYYNLK